MIGKGFIQILFNLVQEGRLDEAVGLDLADEFSQLGGDKYCGRDEVERKWASRKYNAGKHIGLTRLKEWAMEGGWVPEAPRQLPPPDPKVSDEAPAEIEAEITTLQRGDLKMAGEVIKKLARLLLDPVGEEIFLDHIVRAVAPEGASERAKGRARKPLEKLLKQERKQAEDSPLRRGGRGGGNGGKTEAGEAEGGKLTIYPAQTDPEEQVRLIMQEINKRNNPEPSLFSVGSAAVRLKRPVHHGLTDSDAPVEITSTEEVTRDIAKNEVVKVACFKSLFENFMGMPNLTLSTMMGQSSWSLPRLTQIITAPAYTSSGRRVDQSGYDGGSGMYYAPPQGFQVPPVPDKPSAKEIDRAIDLLWDVLRDFPFLSEASLHNAFAAILEPRVRNMIQGTTPIHAVNKMAPRSGGGQLWEVHSRINYGQPAKIKPPPPTDEECSKLITTSLAHGEQLCLFDNLHACLGFPSFAAAVTSEQWSGRILGQTAEITGRIRWLWGLVGNGIVVTEEIAKRCSLINIDAKMPDPGARTDFRHPNLSQYVDAHRAELVWAQLVIIQAWVVADKPPGKQSMAGFEGWAKTMGGILGYIGADKFHTNRNELLDRTQEQELALNPFVAAWWDKHGPASVLVGAMTKDPLTHAYEPTPGTLLALHQDLRDSINLGLRGDKGLGNALGMLLTKSAGRTFDVEGENGRTARVQIVKKQTNQGTTYSLRPT